ncbi:MAG: hypothetical protein M1812_001774 [Candelaria pacifica]|nr:MAG: hypothetical protein M1812_001774 [Candelaria pacifica]
MVSQENVFLHIVTDRVDLSDSLQRLGVPSITHEIPGIVYKAFELQWIRNLEKAVHYTGPLQSILTVFPQSRMSLEYYKFSPDDLNKEALKVILLMGATSSRRFPDVKTQKVILQPFKQLSALATLSIQEDMEIDLHTCEEIEIALVQEGPKKADGIVHPIKSIIEEGVEALLQNGYLCTIIRYFRVGNFINLLMEYSDPESRLKAVCPPKLGSSKDMQVAGVLEILLYFIRHYPDFGSAPDAAKVYYSKAIALRSLFQFAPALTDLRTTQGMQLNDVDVHREIIRTLPYVLPCGGELNIMGCPDEMARLMETGEINSRGELYPITDPHRMMCTFGPP